MFDLKSAASVATIMSAVVALCLGIPQMVKNVRIWMQMYHRKKLKKQQRQKEVGQKKSI